MEASQKITLGNTRIQSVDFIRGLIMIIMAIDHVRVYSGIPAGGLTAGVFFTRWITHYCAPVFTFLAGTSVFLFFRKSGDRSEVSKYLITRGFLLVVLEMTIVRFAWTFNFDYANFVHTNIIWTLGWCMIILSFLVRFKASTVGIAGLIIIFFQQIFQFVPAIFPLSIRDGVAEAWAFFYTTSFTNKSGNILSGASGLPYVMGIGIFYVIIPLIGVMMAGYGFGEFLFMEENKRKRTSLAIGLSAIFLFLIVGTIFSLTGELAKKEIPFIFKLLGQQKYPPSQLYLLMTLGPAIALVPWAEKIKGRLVEIIKIFGRVPLFYYLTHLFLIHISALIVNQLLFGNVHTEWYDTAPFVGIAEEQRWSLALLYLVWAVNVFILYFLCSFYARYKSNHPEKGWLKYI